MADEPEAQLDLVRKDPEMGDVSKVVESVEGRLILKASVSYGDDPERSEEIHLLLDDGTTLRVLSTAVCWYENKTLMRVLPGDTKSPAEHKVTEQALPDSGLVAFREELDERYWEDMVGKKDWPKVIEAIKKAQKSRKA